MSRPLRIAIADDEPDMREFLQRVLSRNGHNVVSVAENGRQLVEQCRALRPELIITDIAMPDVDGVEASRQVVRDQPVPVIVISGHCDADINEIAQADHVMAHLVKPIGRTDLNPAILLATRRFNERQTSRWEAVSGQQSLPDRSVFGQAKGIVTA